MKKRFLLILITILIMVLTFGTLIGCGDTEEPPKEPDNEPTKEYIEGREVIPDKDFLTFSDENMRVFGRTYKSGKTLGLANAGTGVEFTFYGTEVSATISSNSPMYIRTFIDGDKEGTRTKVAARNTQIKIANGLTEGFHTVRLVKATSGNIGDMTINSLSTDGKFIKRDEKKHIRMEFIGDSITVGAGIFAVPSEPCSTDNSDAIKCYAYLTADEFDADFSIVAAEAICTYGTASPYMPNNIDMITMYDTISSLNNKPYTYTKAHDVVVIGLGTNDSSYMNAHPEFDVDAYSVKYKELIDKIRAKNPDAYIVCAFGMMYPDQRVTNGINKAIAACDDEKISYVDLPVGANGGGAHPSVEDAIKQSQTLIEHIRSVVPGLAK